MSIPEWNSLGLIPPIKEDEPTSFVRSPYSADLVSFIKQFATTIERCQIIEGFLNYRIELHKIGIVKGFQWLDGSFLENIELNGGRSPNDIDVVSFFHSPDGVTQTDLATKYPTIFAQHEVKKTFKVDAYFYELGKPMTNYDVKIISYWYSMWSHRRDNVWKGFVQIDLALTHDALASQELETIKIGLDNGI
jgi:hypothetical protein